MHPPKATDRAWCLASPIRRRLAFAAARRGWRMADAAARAGPRHRHHRIPARKAAPVALVQLLVAWACLLRCFRCCCRRRTLSAVLKKPLLLLPPGLAGARLQDSAAVAAAWEAGGFILRDKPPDPAIQGRGEGAVMQSHVLCCSAVQCAQAQHARVTIITAQAQIMCAWMGMSSWPRGWQPKATEVCSVVFTKRSLAAVPACW